MVDFLKYPTKVQLYWDQGAEGATWAALIHRCIHKTSLEEFHMCNWGHYDSWKQIDSKNEMLHGVFLPFSEPI